MLEGGLKSTNIGLEMGVKIGGYAVKIGKNTHLLVVTRVRLSQKIGLINMTNRTRFRKETAINNVLKLCAITEEFVSCYIHRVINTHKKVLTS